MTKSTSIYTCSECGTRASKWSGRCMSCGAWDSLRESAATPARRAAHLAPALKPQKFSHLSDSKVVRYSCGQAQVDQVLGGGIVSGSLTLLAGDPGIGKSTLVLQIVTQLAKKQSVLYVSGEESATQIKLRAQRIHNSSLNPKTPPSVDFELINSNDIDGVLALCAQTHYDLVIIDSIQTMFSASIEGASGLQAQITNNTSQIARAAKQLDTAFIIVGHVTKEGSIAGPRMLEHLVDTVLYLEGERSGGFKVLRSVKNRFGSTAEVGIFSMSEQGLEEIKNPSAYLLRERQAAPGSIVLATMEGTRALLVEVQALVAPTVFGYPKRTAAGVDLNRLNLLAAVAAKRGGLRLSDKDIYVNIVGGLKILEPAVDIAIILAIASGLKNITPKPTLAAFGEVGLSGELRSVAQADRRASEAKRMGFTTVLGPASAGVAGLSYKPTNIAEAIELLG